MPVPDLFAAGLARGWTTYDGSRLEDDLTLEADVAIVGSGAGAGITADAYLEAQASRTALYRRFVALFEDITEQRQARIELNAARAAAARHEMAERLEMAAQAAKFGVYERNYDSQACYWSRELKAIAEQLGDWQLVPAGTEGYRTAEVTLGGVDTREVSSKTMESLKSPGLYFVGEVLDVTGHLGGFNFQWAWASGYAAAQYV